MSKELIIYADESITKGKLYSNFYGGAIVSSKDLAYVNQTLNNTKNEQNLFREIKWTKVTSNYLEKYKAVMNVLFELMKTKKLKMRIMFTQNRHIPKNLNTYHDFYRYHLLYYQFIKHAFGLKYVNPTSDPIQLRLYLDAMPQQKEENARFKGFLVGLEKSPEFRHARIKIDINQIAEVSSHKHVILQCLDVVLGAMQFRLNHKHKIKPEGEYQRGKKTVAKERLYKCILAHIREIYPNFNIGITTGQTQITDRWHHPYRHWLFIPKKYRINEGYKK